jgi:hypothetical protein
VKRPDKLFCMSGQCSSFIRTLQYLVPTHAVVPVFYMARCVRTVFVIHPDEEPCKVISHSPLRRITLLTFSLFFFLSFVCFSLSFSRAFLTCSCLFVISLHPRYVSLPFFTFLFSFYAKNSGFFWDYLFLGLCELNFILLLIFSVLG